MGKVLRIYMEREQAASAGQKSAGADFDLFWDCYPKKKAKLDAMKAWRQTVDLRPPMDELIAALDLQAQSDDWNRDGGQYIPFPGSWLRGGRWADE